MKHSKKIYLIIYSILYICLFIILTCINRDNSGIYIGEIEVSSQSLCGILCVILNSIAVYITLRFGKLGFFTATVLCTASIIPPVIKLIIGNTSDSLPGIFILLGAIAVVHIVRKFLKRIESDEASLVKMANTDILTELPNRRGFIEYLDKLMKADKGRKVNFAVAFMDLDNFKNINDTVGHLTGDDVLKEIVGRWRSMLHDSVFLSRQGGDEFAFVISGKKTRDEVIEEVNRYKTALSYKIDCNETHFYITGSVGIAMYPEHSTNASNLLRYADMAMYYAKREGRDKIAVYDELLMQDLRNDIEMENAIRECLWSNNFFLNYQPQYDILTKKIRGFECLVRMRDKNNNIISPDKFIPIAERTSFIIDIERFVFQHAMEDFLPLVGQNKDIMLSINVSVIHLMHEAFLDDLRQALTSSGFPPQQLEIEITESVLIGSTEHASDVLESVKAMGISIALDDFGTGYASLSYLNKLPIDLLKIDKVFVDSLRNDAKSHNGKTDKDFIAAIISMGHLLHFSVISEGVEEDSQRDTLKKLGCDYLQGFLWGRPMSYDNVCALIKSNKEL